MITRKKCLSLVENSIDLSYAHDCAVITKSQIVTIMQLAYAQGRKDSLTKPDVTQVKRSRNDQP